MLGGRRPTFKARPGAKFLVPMGLVGGTLDSIGGGGWGPVGTTTLLSSGRLEPRKVVGSIDTSEFVVAVGGSLGFLLALGSAGIPWDYALALLAGGVIAAPIAAWLVKHLPARVLGVAAGGLIVLTNTKTIAEALGRRRPGRRPRRCASRSLWISGIVWAVSQERKARALEQREGAVRRGLTHLGTTGGRRDSRPAGRSARTAPAQAPRSALRSR